MKPVAEGVRSIREQTLIQKLSKYTMVGVWELMNETTTQSLAVKMTL